MKRHIKYQSQQRPLPMKAIVAPTAKEVLDNAINFLFFGGPNPKDIVY